MKYKVSQDTKSFQPVTVTFTLETQKELDAMATLFNCVPITFALEKMGLETKSTMFNDTNADANLTTELCDLLKFIQHMRNRKF